MTPEVAANLAAGGVDAANNILSQGIAYFRDRAARKWQEEMWEKQNEYNLPVNQRKRLEDAGINPNLAFGSSASAMGSSLPGSPSQHVPQTNLGEFWLRYKQAKADIKRQNAETERSREITRAMEMNNEILSQLFSEKLETMRGDMYVQRIEQGWKEDHLRQLLDLGITSKEVENDLKTAQKLYNQALTAKTQQQRENLVQEYNHLVKKYGFEDYYYDMRVNPYETSTPIGFLRAVYGPMSMFFDYLTQLFNLPNLNW